MIRVPERIEVMSDKEYDAMVQNTMETTKETENPLYVPESWKSKASRPYTRSRSVFHHYYSSVKMPVCLSTILK